ncbi:Aste57867_12735 [Aphanomyces stellatus]|uniref:Aste57867_12735 protein n=1 Tax=Aphanomyces stellatus TaxID=120398 RepID=A0A485KX60_9STRA|nr:hypothetical protein As57867_012687 [Aphanomyces stellatus]VFT89585.1 Aste57867_12735 [Aphanomyces stellatus]
MAPRSRWIAGSLLLYLVQGNPCSTTPSVTNTWDFLPSSAAGFDPRDGHASVKFLNKLWVVGGQTGSYTTRQLIQTTRRSDVWMSVDGNNWTQVIDESIFPRRFGHTLTVFPEKTMNNAPLMVLMGGFSPIPANDIWYTQDGVTWTQVNYTVPWSPRGWHCAFVYNNYLWVAGGSPLNNQVWATDSIVQGTWRQMPDADWSIRAGHSCVNHQTKNATLGDASTQDLIVVLAGWGDGSASFNDVWSMDTSYTWTQLTPAAPWPIRAWTAALSFHSMTQDDAILGPRLWIFGGGRIGIGVNLMFTYSDVWQSRDGINWIGTSSDRLGESTVQWCQVTVGDNKVCVGKWGHTVLAHTRPVAGGGTVNVCGTQCWTNDKTTFLAGTIIGQCNSSIPPPTSATSTSLVGNIYQVSTTNSDGCGSCATARYYTTPSVPAVVFIGGSSGDEKVSDVFRSTDYFLCESGGVMCSNQGFCGAGGACVCDPGYCGDYCDQTVPPSLAMRDATVSMWLVGLVLAMGSMAM